MAEVPRARAVILDFNNTVVDAFSAFAELDVAVARDRFGETITREDVRRLWGSLPQDMYPALFRRPSTPWEELAAEFRQYRDEHTQEERFHPKAYPGSIQALHALRGAGLQLCLATGGSSQVVYADMAYNGIPPEWFGHIQFPLEDDPKPLEPIVTHLGALGIRASETAMVGDDMVDYRAAQRVELGRFVAVSTGVTATAQDFLQAGVPAGDIVPSIAQVPALLVPGA